MTLCFRCWYVVQNCRTDFWRVGTQPNGTSVSQRTASALGSKPSIAAMCPKVRILQKRPQTRAVASVRVADEPAVAAFELSRFVREPPALNVHANPSACVVQQEIWGEPLCLL